MKLIKLLAAALFSLGLGSSAMADSSFIIGAGAPGRGYDVFAHSLADSLEKKEVQLEVVNFSGSDEISRAVCDGKAQFGVLQIDALYSRQKEGCNLTVIARYGNEYAYFFVPPEGRTNDMDDLGANSKILADTELSGSMLALKTMMTIDQGPQGNKSSWSFAKPVALPVGMADGQASAGLIDAVFLVAKPNSGDVKRLYELGWQLADWSDKDIDDQQFNGTSLYKKATVSIEGTSGFLRSDVSAAGYVIPSFLVMNSEVNLTPRQMNDLIQAASSSSR